MSKNKELLNLFGFLMELLDVNTSTKTNEEVLVKEIKTDQTEDKGLESVYRLANPSMPPHPVLNPMIEYKNPLENIAKHSVELIKKMDDLDKMNGQEVLKTRTVKKATGPLIDEIKKLKEEARKNATESMNNEVKEYLEETGERVGMVLDGGEIKPVKIPTELRNNIPLSKDDNAEPISRTFQEHLEKISKESQNTNSLPQSIKDAMMDAPNLTSGNQAEVLVKEEPKKKSTRKRPAKRPTDKVSTKKRKTNKK